MQLQYIGARYVPIWYENTDDQSSNWQVNVEYEPLTWVTTTNNHLYLSKKTVPDNIGNPADNTEYWLDLGVFISGQYELLQGQIDTINNVTIPGIENEIAHINDRRFIFVGDSYLANTDNWGSTVITSLGLTLNDDVFVVGAGSRGFIGDPNQLGDMSFLALLQGASASITDHDTITDIIVCGGINDSYVDQGDPLIAAVQSFCSYCNTEYPNAKIHCGMIGYTTDKNILARLAATRFFYVRGMAQYGNMIPNAEKFVHYTGYMNDSVHPNATGMQNIGNAITEYIRYGYSEAIESIGGGTFVSDNFSDYFAGCGAFSYLTNLLGDTVRATIQASNTLDSPTSITFDHSWHKIGTLTNPSYIVGGNHNFSQLSNGTISVLAGGDWYNFSSLFTIVGGELYVKPMIYKTLTVNTLVVNAEITLPAIGN